MGDAGPASGVVGRVSMLVRYPVKSTLGERVTAAQISERGLAGDRTHAVLDAATGRVASAKHPRRWQGLLAMSSRSAGAAPGAAVSITLKDGTVTGSEDADVDERLSRELRRAVCLVARRAQGAAIERSVPEAVLARGPDAEVPMAELTLGAGAPGTSFVDYAPLHVMTTGTVGQISALSPCGDVAVARYRPNIVVETPMTGWVENGWVGGVLEVGVDVLLRVIVPTPRCAVPSLAHGTLPRDPEAVRIPFRHNRRVVLGDAEDTGCAGVYAEVIRAGTVRDGDPVRLTPASAAPRRVRDP